MSRTAAVIVIIAIIMGSLVLIGYIGQRSERITSKVEVSQPQQSDNQSIIDSILQRLDVIESKLNITGTPSGEPPTPSCPDNYAWNGTACVSTQPIPQPPKPVCKDNEVYNETTDSCQPAQQPEPTPTPLGKTVIIVGDVEGSTAGKAVFDQISKQRPDLVILAGDLGYTTNLDWVKSTYGTFGNRLSCVPGNHDSAENGGTAITQLTLAYCGNDYYIKLDRTIFFGINTNGDLNTQLTKSLKLLGDPAFMNGIKAVHLVSHKPCNTPANSHHGVEANVKAFCDKFFAAVPPGVQKFADNAHNHNMVEGLANGISYHTSGAGGRDHYPCGTISGIWEFCNDKNYGFLKYTIGVDGSTADQFIDYNGKILH